MARRVRALTAEEPASIRRLAQSRTDPARLVERARLIWLGSQGQRVPAIATALRLSEATVRQWLKRLNAPGVEGVPDQPRAGRPPTYTAEAVGEVLARALTSPRSLGRPCAS